MGVCPCYCGLDLGIHDASDLRDRSQDLEIDDLKHIVPAIHFAGALGVRDGAIAVCVLLWP